MIWITADPEMLGLIPTFLLEGDPRPAREQFAERYQFGGWDPTPGFTLHPITRALKYPGDPTLHPVGFTMLHDREVVLVYPYGLVMILQANGDFEVARMD